MAVITGAASGIGRAIAHKFAANGASVCLLDVDRKHAEAVAAEITSAGGTASAYECDVSDRASIGSTFCTILQQGRVHILVNNAGVSHIGTVESTTELDFDRAFRINVKGYFNCINAVIGKMKSAGGGVILNMASVAGSTGLAERFAYSTSKGAAIAMTYSVARDYIGHNVRCNCVSPARVAYDIRRWLSGKELPRPRAGNIRETGEDTTYRQNGKTGRSSLACPLLVFGCGFVHYRSRLPS